MAINFWAAAGLAAACIATPTLAAPIQSFTTSGFVNPSATDDGFLGQSSIAPQSPVARFIQPAQTTTSPPTNALVNTIAPQTQLVVPPGSNGGSGSSGNTLAPPSGGSSNSPVPTVPLPSSLPMFGGALMALALGARALRRRAVRAS